MSNKRKLYKVHKFNFDVLFKCGKIDKEQGILFCSKLNSEYAEIKNEKTLEVDKKGDCQLFDQTRKALNIKEDNESIFEEVFVNIDFSEFVKNHSLASNLRKIPNGIKLYIYDKEIHVLDFLKSNSMSKNCCVYYINKDYKNIIEPRVTFNLNKGTMILSKWYAYSGLAISDSTILPNYRLSEDEIVIIPDAEQHTNIECITAISVPLLKDKISIISNKLKELHTYNINFNSSVNNCIYEGENKDIVYSIINNLLIFETEINSYYNSKDFERIKNEEVDKKKIKFNRDHIINILEKINNFSVLSLNELEKLINEINEEYRYFNIKEQESIQGEYKENEIYWEKFHVYNYPVTINKFDGEGLIDKEYARMINLALNDTVTNFDEEDDENYDNLMSAIFGYDVKDEQEEKVEIKKKKGFSFQIRLPFIKGVVHACEFKKFFKSKGIKQIYGKTFEDHNLRAYDIEKVKLILTESQFKASGFIKNIKRKENESPISAFFRIMNEYDYFFAISNLEPKHDNKVKLNYQFVSTIPFFRRDLDNILLDNRRLFNHDISNHRVAKELSQNDKNEQNIFETNKEFYYSTSRFKEVKNKLIKDRKRDLLKIKLECPGYRKLICSDLLELLYYAAYHNSNEEYKLDYLKNYEFYAPNTKIDSFNDSDADHCILLRNPHYSRNEIGVLKQMKELSNNERVEYFGHLTGVIMFNPVSLTAERLGGADYDGDTLVLLNNRYRSNTVRKLLNKNKKPRYPLIRIPSLQTDKVLYNYNHIVESFENTFSSRVGLISYDAMHKSFEVYSNGNNDEEEIMPFYTILSGLEIDSAKKGVKPYLIDTQKNKNAQLFLDFNKALKSDKSYKDYEKNIKDLDFNHVLFDVCNDIFNYDINRDNRKYNLNLNSDFSKEERLKAISIFMAYENIMNIRKTYQRDKIINKIKNKTVKSIIDNINYILRLKDIEENDVLKYFDSLDAEETFKEYCRNKDKFHYFFNDDEKINFIINELGFSNIPDDVLKLVIDFENKGSYLLYLILYYWSKIDDNKASKYKELINDNKEISEEFINKTAEKYLVFNTFATDEIKFIVNEVARMKEEIIDISNYKIKNHEIDSVLKEVNELERNAIKYLRQEASKISSDACIFIIKEPQKANIIFDVFNNQVIEILRREEVVING